MRRVLPVLALLAAAPALAHEVLHEVRWGRSVAVHAWLPDGRSLAYVDAEVFSPRDPAIPHWKGRTDRNGWLAFVPDAPGAWRVRLIDAAGHGLDTTVEVPAGPGGDGAAPGAAPGAKPAPGANTTGPSPLAFVLRPAVGVAVVLAVFGVIALARRRREP